MAQMYSRKEVGISWKAFGKIVTVGEMMPFVQFNCVMNNPFLHRNAPKFCAWRFKVREA